MASAPCPRLVWRESNAQKYAFVNRRLVRARGASEEASSTEDANSVRWDVVRRRAEKATARIRGKTGSDASKVLRKALRPVWEDDDGDIRGTTTRGVTNAERRAIADAVLGAEVWRLRIAKETATAREKARTSEDVREVLRRAAEHACESEDAGVSVLVYWCARRGGEVGEGDGWMRNEAKPTLETLREMYGEGVDALVEAIRDENIAWARDTVLGISERYSFPSALVRLFVDEYGAEEAELLARAMNSRGPVVCRAHCKNGKTKEDIVEMLRNESNMGRVEPIFANLAPRAFWLVDGAPPAGGILGSPTWLDGYYEVQDEGSQMIVNALEAQPSDVILDACAGNGGKTLALAGEMQETGSISAFDIDTRRLTHLMASAKRAGVSHLIRTLSSNDLDAMPDKSFDAIIVDAPCSSVGALRRAPSLRYAYDDPHQLAAIQSSILRRVHRLLKPNGRLVYATCSVLSIENQNVARAFEAENSDIKPWRFEDSVPTSPTVSLESHERLLLPHIVGTDGFYIARYKKCALSS